MCSVGSPKRSLPYAVEAIGVSGSIDVSIGEPDEHVPPMVAGGKIPALIWKAAGPGRDEPEQNADAMQVRTEPLLFSCPSIMLLYQVSEVSIPYLPNGFAYLPAGEKPGNKRAKKP